ncbi:hypothetical protein FXV83_39645 [Bradyrhizobium hipponense]|uniref:HTH cro/C1-type domain-containing protein n=1 Tax=Bradyrhizobium hipponense TaxID=2605638 RepID=A0A5S4YLG2_9BRAD|nr:hypothetical protein FXV83_39645 [Bradyrhizobium hipponense]
MRARALLAYNVRRIRVQRGIPQEQLAYDAEVDRSYMSGLERQQAGARYDHNYLALPAIMTGKCLLVAPEIIVSDLVRGGALQIIPGSRAPSGMQYRAYAVDRSAHPEIARSFCRWLARLCNKVALAQAA